MDAEEIYQLNKQIFGLQKSVESEKKAAQEEIAKVKKYYAEKEKAKQSKSSEVCIGVALQKENRKLKEKLERNEQARISYEEYQEKRVFGLKSELKRLREMSSQSSVAE